MTDDMPLFTPTARQMSAACPRAGHASICARVLCAGVAAVAVFAAQGSPGHAQPQQTQPTMRAADVQAVLTSYCVGCHNERTGTANIAFETLDVAHPGARPATWEKVVRKLRTGTMPPGGRPRPDAETYAAVAGWLETQLDAAWQASPNPGRINVIHRLNRAEYNNAIRDLLALDVDVRTLLPGDETADGSFDNVAGSLTISTAHMERYMSVARQVTRMAVGLPPGGADFKIFRGRRGADAQLR